MFSAGPSCGPTNPLQNFGKHAGETSASQRERFVSNQQQTPGFRSGHNLQAREQLNNEFQQFQHAGSSMNSAEMFRAPQHQPHMHQHQHHTPSPVQGDWASEFEKLNLSSASPLPHQLSNQQHPHYQQPQHRLPPQPQLQHSASNWQHEFMKMDAQAPATTSALNINPSIASQFATSQGIAMQPEHRQIHHINAKHEAENRAFEAAFDQVQQTLDKEEKEVEAVDETAQKEGEDLSHVARTIVNSISGSNSMSEHTTQKLQNSYFMNLMQQLSEKKVVLEGEKFVDETGSDVGTVERAKLQEEQQQQQPSTRSRSNSHTRIDPSPISKDQEAHLPNPVVYMEKEGVMSSFLAAQELGPNGLAKGSEWEEDYEAWANEGQ